MGALGDSIPGDVHRAAAVDAARCQRNRCWAAVNARQLAGWLPGPHQWWCLPAGGGAVATAGCQCRWPPRCALWAEDWEKLKWLRGSDYTKKQVKPEGEPFAEKTEPGIWKNSSCDNGIENPTSHYRTGAKLLGSQELWRQSVWFCILVTWPDDLPRLRFSSSSVK